MCQLVSMLCHPLASKPTGSDGFSGFLDPAGFSEKGDEAGFVAIAPQEIEHGKVP